MPKPADEPERKTYADKIQNRGWHIPKVLEDGRGPGFAYTVGLHHSFDHPELIVVGLSADVGHSVLNVAGDSIRQGARYSAGIESAAIFENRPCAFREMPTSPVPQLHRLGAVVLRRALLLRPAARVARPARTMALGCLQSTSTSATCNPSSSTKAIPRGRRVDYAPRSTHVSGTNCRPRSEGGRYPRHRYQGFGPRRRAGG